MNSSDLLVITIFMFLAGLIALFYLQLKKSLCDFWRNVSSGFILGRFIFHSHFCGPSYIC